MLNTKSQIMIMAMLTLVGGFTAVSASTKSTYTEIEWIQLMPADDLQALLNPPEFLSEIEDGSENDNIEVLKERSITDESAKRFKEALKSSRVVEAFDKQSVRIPGFLVPLEANEEQLVTEFFIVPYFGACLHLPPPPPNQIIYSQSTEGIELDSLQIPFWFEGTIVIDQTETEQGSSAYSLQLDNVHPFGS